MARQLTKPMKEVLRIMAEGHVIELWQGIASHNRYWDFEPFRDPYVRPLANTVRALQRRKLIREELPFEKGWSVRVVARYALTNAGRRAEKELA